MALDPGIILSGLQPDPFGSFDKGLGTRNSLETLRDRNAVRDVFTEFGSGIAAGQPDALARLAALDPGLAQQAREQADRTRYAEVNAGREQTIFDAQIAAGQREAELAQTRQALTMLATADTPEKWDQLAQQFAPEFVGRFAERDALTAMFRDLEDVLRPDTPDVPRTITLPGGGIGYMQPDGQGGWGLVTLAEGDETPNAPSGYRYNDAGVLEFIPGGPADPAVISGNRGGGITFRPDGTVQIGGNERPLTERQSQLSLFGSMMAETAPVIDAIEQRFDPANLGDQIAGAAGTLGNFFKSPEYRTYETAGRAWAEGVLRIQTGAAATASEIDRVFTTYFAQAGDTPEAIAFKRRLRTAFYNAVAGASSGAVQGATGGLPPPDAAPPALGATGGSAPPPGPVAAPVAPPAAAPPPTPAPAPSPAGGAPAGTLPMVPPRAGIPDPLAAVPVVRAPAGVQWGGPEFTRRAVELNAALAAAGITGTAASRAIAARMQQEGWTR